ncbi:hypothetical protein OT109_15735 [Phycisphaeraceae bacterium D3-23]
MPPPSDPSPPAAPAQPAAAQFLRSAAGFGAVAFREEPGCVALIADPDDGHGDCLPSWAWLGEWSWRDPEAKAAARTETQR